ncbi:hypothetical protein BGZ60DRAFT_400657 [Tricladium varicosporioides]|nr:hypothetical protein BGZ60DRAFT_400657 [Hymenoscyphus varicosporioides]
MDAVYLRSKHPRGEVDHLTVFLRAAENITGSGLFGWRINREAQVDLVSTCMLVIGNFASQVVLHDNIKSFVPNKR